MNQGLRVWVIGWRCSSGGSVSAEGCYWGPHPVDWMTPHNLIHSVIMPNAGKHDEEEEEEEEEEEKNQKKIKGSRRMKSLSFSEYFMKNYFK